MLTTVAIIGAGPAGSVAAVLLARRGGDVRVDLIEQHRFPRDKVCGECLSALGFDVMRRAGLERAFAALDPIRLTRTILHAADGTRAELPLATPMWGLSRRRLDEFLLEAAHDAGAFVHQPARCERIDVAAPAVEIRDLVTNQTHPIGAEYILLADGKSALLPMRPCATGDLGLKAHFAMPGSPHDAIELFGLDGHYVGVAPVAPDRWNLAFSVPRAKLNGGAADDLDDLVHRLVAPNRALATRMRRATRLTDWLTCPLPRFAVRNDWPNRIIPLGNAAAALEPIGGEGMGLAMRSAELAVESILTGESPDALRRRFVHLWRPRRLATRAAARLLSSRRFGGPSVDFSHSAPELASAAMRWMGKV